MNPGILVGVGFLLGAASAKIARSERARKACVKGIVCMMKARESVEGMVDEARAQFDDMMAEAQYQHGAEEPASLPNGEATA